MECERNFLYVARVWALSDIVRSEKISNLLDFISQKKINKLSRSSSQHRTVDRRIYELFGEERKRENLTWNNLIINRKKNRAEYDEDDKRLNECVRSKEMRNETAKGEPKEREEASKKIFPNNITYEQEFIHILRFFEALSLTKKMTCKTSFEAIGNYIAAEADLRELTTESDFTSSLSAGWLQLPSPIFRQLDIVRYCYLINI